MELERRRQDWLDRLKGLAILLVIMGHILSGYMDAKTFPDAGVTIYMARTAIYRFHMPLFFFLSGYTSRLAYYDGAGRLRAGRYLRQLCALLWLYVLFEVLLWALHLWFPAYVNASYTASDILGIFFEPLGNYWYLYVLALFYIAAALLRMPRMHPMYLLLLGGLSLAVQVEHLGWTHLTLYRFLYHLLFFFAGIQLCGHPKLLKSHIPLGCSLMILAAALFFHAVPDLHDWFFRWQPLYALALSFALCALFSRFRPLRRDRLLRLLGRNCLIIYLLHPCFTAGLRTLLPAIGVTGAAESVWLNFFLSTAGSLLLALLLPKIPGIRRIFRPEFRRLTERFPE